MITNASFMNEPPISPQEARALRRFFSPHSRRRRATLRLAIETALVAAAIVTNAVNPALLNRALHSAAIPTYVLLLALAGLAIDAFSTVGATALNSLVRTLYRRFGAK